MRLVTFRREFLVVCMAACGSAQTAKPTAQKPVASVTASAPAVAVTIPQPQPKPQPTRCQVLETALEERVREAFAKANADALAAVREERDPISKRLAVVRAAIAKAKPAELDALKEQAAKLEDRRQRERPSRSDAGLMGLDALRAKNVCVDARDAAWATTLAKIEVVPTDQQPWDEPGAWVVHAEHVVVRFDGAKEVSAPIASLVSALPKDATVEARAIPPRDLDGDGASEWFVFVGVPKTASFYRVITVQGDAVRAYAKQPPMEITRIRVERDGNLLFFHTDFLGAYKPCGQLTEKDVWGPPFAMDVQPDGTFSTTTPRARASNQSDFCSDPPERLYTVDQVVCAKMSGVDAATLVARVRKDNVPAVCDVMQNGNELRNFNEQYKFLLDAAKLAVPYTK